MRKKYIGKMNTQRKVIMFGIFVWIAIFNYASMYIQKEYYMVEQINMMKYDEVSVPIYMAILEDNNVCKIDVVNSQMMDNIMEDIEIEHVQYYTSYEYNEREENLCEVPITFGNMFIEKILLKLSVIVMSFSISIIIIYKVIVFLAECDYASNSQHTHSYDLENMMIV